MTDRLRKFNIEPVAVAIVGISVFGHIYALDYTRTQLSDQGIVFFLELQPLIGASLVGAIAGAVLTRRIPFRAAFVLRGFVVAIIFRILGAAGIVPRLVLLSLLIAEVAFYETNRTAMIASIVLGVSAVLNEVIVCGPLDPVEARTQILGTALVVAGIAPGANLLAKLHERAVADERKIRDLNTALDRLTTTNLGLQAYAADARAKSAFEERGRITRELHDSIGYAMTNIAMTMNASKILVRGKDEERLLRLLENTRVVAHDCLQETRTTLYRLRSVIGPERTGLQLLAHLALVYSDATGIEVRTEFENARPTYGNEVDETIYRLVQEGLTNAFRHNREETTRTRVQLHEAAEVLEVRVWDNGRGPGEVKEGIGLRGMRERVEAIGGTLQLRNTASGFEVYATIPLATGEDSGEHSSSDC